MLADYKKLVNADKVVINTRFYRPDGRSESDAGMINIFQPERLSTNLGKRIQNCLHEKLIQRLLLVSSLNQMKVKCRNLYLNGWGGGRQDTPIQHCNGRSLKFKSLVYTSDINELNDDPYCYVKGSHRRRSI